MYIGWDVGVKNLAYCVMDEKCKILEWDIIDLSNKKEYFCCGINKTNKNKCSNKAHHINPNTCKTFCNRHSKNETDLIPIFQCFKCSQKARRINLKDDIFYCAKHCPNKDEYEDIVINRNVAKTSLNRIATILVKKLDSNPIFLKATHVVIENQPSLKNPTMKSIQMIIYSYFLIKLNCKVKLTLMSAKFKLRFDIDNESVTKIKKMSDRYQRNKKLAIEFCRHFIEGEWIIYFENYKNKKDDLADSYLMTRYYILYK